MLCNFLQPFLQPLQSTYKLVTLLTPVQESHGVLVTQMELQKLNITQSLINRRMVHLHQNQSASQV